MTSNNVELIPKEALADHNVLVHNGKYIVVQLNVAQHGKMSLFPKNNQYTEFYFSPVFRHPITMRMAKENKTLISINSEINKIHEELINDVNKICLSQENDEEKAMLINQKILKFNESFEKIMKINCKTNGCSDELLKMIKNPMKFSYDLESNEKFLERMTRINTDLLYTKQPDFVCLQEVEIKNKHMTVLDSLMDEKYEAVLPTFGNLNTQTLQSCAITLYNAEKYQPYDTADSTKLEIITKIFNLMYKTTNDSQIGNNNKINVMAFENIHTKMNIYMINIHADFTLTNNLRGNKTNLINLMTTIDSLFKIFGNKLCICGDFNIMKKTYDSQIEESQFCNTRIEKILTPDLGTDIQPKDERTYDIIFTSKIENNNNDIKMLNEINLLKNNYFM
jgi:exonuclease III